ncbi:hypothetical protein Tco_1450246, partial [Tanacetum coccineum]
MAATTMWLWLPRQDTGDGKTTLTEYIKVTSLSGHGTKHPPWLHPQLRCGCRAKIRDSAKVRLQKITQSSRTSLAVLYIYRNCGQGSERDSVLPKGKCPRNESSLLERMNEFVEIGLGQKAKKQWVRELCYKNKISFLSLQETKMEEMEDNVVRSLWGNMDFDYSHSPSVGFS